MTKLRNADFGILPRLPTATRPLTTITAIPHQAVPSYQPPTAIVSVAHQAVPSFSPPVIVAAPRPPPSMAITPYNPKGSGALPQAAHDAAAMVVASTPAPALQQQAAAAAAAIQQTSDIRNSGMQVAPIGSISSGGGGGGGGMPDTSSAPLPSFDDGSSGAFDSPSPDIRTSLSMPVTRLPNPTNAINAVNAAVAPKSLWQRFLAFLGFGPKTPAIAVHGETGDLRSMVASVVRRARNGDQNAMALMALVRDNAAKGHPRAMESAEHLNEYIRNNPVVADNRSNPRIGDDGTYADAVALSHGPKLDNHRIVTFLSRFGGEERQAVEYGIRHKAAANAVHPQHSQAIRMGKIVGQARRIQVVREPGSSMKVFDSNVGWELE